MIAAYAIDAAACRCHYACYSVIIMFRFSPYLRQRAITLLLPYASCCLLAFATLLPALRYADSAMLMLIDTL